MNFFKKLNDFIWGYPLIFLLLGTHIFFTIRLHFIQCKTKEAIHLSLHSDSDGHGDLSGFAALATTLAATLGTGNIIGVSTAIYFGGPGAIFWCWLTGILGMATTYAESYLSILFRKITKEGNYVGGPMYFLEQGLHKKKLAMFYAFCTIAASFGVGCTTQSNAIATTVQSVFGCPPTITGFLVAIPVGLVIIGSISSIGKVCTKMVPAMGAFYILGCIILLFKNYQYIIPALSLIIKSIYSSSALKGGLLGGSIQLALRYGVARGLFTNESGLGSAGIAAASAITTSPKRQALISMTATFWDTVVMCAITGLVIITNGIASPASLNQISSGELTTAAFRSLPYGEDILALSLISFAVATLIGWSYFGEKATQYLFSPKGMKPYQFFYIIMIFIGAIMNLDLVWELTDLINAFMALPCIYGLIRLAKYVRI